MQNPKGVVVSVGAIVHNNSKVLLLRRKGGHGAGTWSTPGGILILVRRLRNVQCGKRKRRLVLILTA